MCHGPIAERALVDHFVAYDLQLVMSLVRTNAGERPLDAVRWAFEQLQKSVAVAPKQTGYAIEAIIDAGLDKDSIQVTRSDS